LTRPRAVVIATGSELVRGARRDANGPFLASELLRLGVDPARIIVVGDRPDELEAAIREGLQADVCVTSGGLGPTHDDRTIELLARATGRELVVDQELEREIEQFSRGIAARLGRPYADFETGVTKQASLPAGAVAIGLAGTAPGVLLEHDGRIAIALPGPPAELQRLWRLAIAAPAFRRLVASARPQAYRLLRFFGPSESAVAQALDEAGGEGDGVEVTVCARNLEIHVDLFIEEGSERRGEELEEALLERFGATLFSRDERPVEEIVLDLSRARGLTLATAESCTGGMVGARLTDVAGSSDVFLGAVVAYADSAKEQLLGVRADELRRNGAVSAETAAAMAAGARRALGADVAAAVTGIAGPGGGTPDKPVGLVYVHAESPHGALDRRLELPGDRETVRLRATAIVLHLLRALLTQP
jgi:competence/damage-inducible protein CinA-like protein